MFILILFLFVSLISSFKWLCFFSFLNLFQDCNLTSRVLKQTCIVSWELSCPFFFIIFLSTNVKHTRRAVSWILLLDEFDTVYDLIWMNRSWNSFFNFTKFIKIRWYSSMLKSIRLSLGIIFNDLGRLNLLIGPG